MRLSRSDSDRANHIIRENIHLYDGVGGGKLIQSLLAKDGLQLTINAIQKRVERMRLAVDVKEVIIPDKEVPEVVEHDRVEAGWKALVSNLNKKNGELMKTLGRLELERDAILAIKNSKDSHVIKPLSSGKDSEATAIVLASDWHVEEPVTLESTSGENEYNLELAEQRADMFFQKILRLVKKERQDVTIKNLVLGLLGDFISNDIHDELLETSLLEPQEAILFAQDLIRSGIKLLLSKSDLKITVVCKVGNHSRTTKRPQSNETGHSLEYFMYHSLAHEFRDDKRIEFIIDRSYHTYLDVYGYTIRFHHGHAMRGGSGIGGIAVPILRTIAKWNVTRRADLDVFGHFHQLIDGGTFICNGSMIGYNAFAQRMAFSAEPPKQAFFLLDSKRGKTVSAPIMFI